MTVSIKVNIVRDLPADNQYRVAFTVIDNVGIAPEVFVFDTEHQTYSNVAGVRDMDVWPANLATALSDNTQCYRQSSVTMTFPNVKEATAFESVTKNRLHILTAAWDSVGSSYPGSDTYTAES